MIKIFGLLLIDFIVSFIIILICTILIIRWTAKTCKIIKFKEETKSTGGKNEK